MRFSHACLVLVALPAVAAAQAIPVPSDERPSSGPATEAPASPPAADGPATTSAPAPSPASVPAAVPPPTPAAEAASDTRDDADDDDTRDAADDEGAGYLASGWQYLISAELGGLQARGLPGYGTGLGGALAFSAVRGAVGMEFLLAGAYAMLADDAIHAVESAGEGTLTALSLRLRSRALRAGVGLGVAAWALPVLARSSAGHPYAQRVTNAGPMVAARFELLRTRRGNLYVEARGLVPVLSEVPPPYYVLGEATATGAMATVRADDRPATTLMVGLGFELWLHRE